MFNPDKSMSSEALIAERHTGDVQMLHLVEQVSLPKN